MDIPKKSSKYALQRPHFEHQNVGFFADRDAQRILKVNLELDDRTGELSHAKREAQLFHWRGRLLRPPDQPS